MSEIRTNHTLEQVRVNFDLLLDNLSKIAKEVRPRTNILNTKLGRIKKDLANIESLNKNELSKTAEIAIKYNAINSIFSRDVKFNKKDLFKIIEGTSNYEKDSNDNYNDFFFELSMASRFLLALQKNNENIKINLAGDCDIILDDTLAIECKYIHSSSNMLKNIQKADSQVSTRVNDGEAKSGFIALDLSHICSRRRIDDFVDFTFNRFVENYEILKKKKRLSGDLLELILNDNNFLKIISNYIMVEVETSLYSEIGLTYKMGPHTMAIIFQSANSFVFEYQGNTRPLSTRGMTYFVNTELSSEMRNIVEKFIHKLAVGI